MSVPCAVCSNTTFITLVREASADELADFGKYASMANMVDFLPLKALVAAIGDEEFGHFKTFSSILAMCGLSS